MGTGIDRRAFINASSAALSGMVSALASSRIASAQAVGPPEVPPALTTTSVTPELIAWVQRTGYDDLPGPVQHEAKRYILDAIGCGLAGYKTDKANFAVNFARHLGGRGEARILGARERVPASAAAFANGELINALDFDAIPHIPPLILPPVLAVAELAKASGKSLMVATVMGHDISSRLASQVMTMGTVLAARHVTPAPPQFFGIGHETIIASAAVASHLLGLDAGKTASAMGLAAYLCPVPASHDWETGSPMSMVKYTPMGWIGQGAVTAALLVRDGYTGNPAALDGVAGFPVFYAKKFWDANAIVAGLGETWRIQQTSYKPYACCRFMHAQLDCAADLVKTHGLSAETIDSIYTLGAEFGANPRMLDVRTQEDAQFSIPYMMANICAGLGVTPEAQSRARLEDPRVRALMKKIRWGVHPANKVEIARVEIVAGGKTYVGETTNVQGAPVTGYALTDEQLSAKFHMNAAPRLGEAGARRAADMIWSLEKVKDTGDLMEVLSG